MDVYMRQTKAIGVNYGRKYTKAQRKNILMFMLFACYLLNFSN